MARYNIPKIWLKYNSGHNMQSIIIKMTAINAGIFFPIKIGRVRAPSFLSPSTSSMSLIISRAVVMTKAKNPRNTDVIMMLGLLSVNPPKTNPKPVIKPTARLPIKGVAFSLYAYR